MLSLVPTVWFLLQHPARYGNLIKSIWVIVAAILIYLTVKHQDAREKNNMWAYLILSLGSLVFCKPGPNDTKRVAAIC